MTRSRRHSAGSTAPSRSTPFLRPRRALTAGVLAGAALVACGGGTTATSTTVPAEADVVVRAVEGIAWDAASYTAVAENGEVSIWSTNDSGVAHNLHVQTPDGDSVGDFIDLPRRDSNGLKTWKLAPGEYRLVCLVPGHQNMNSLLTVS